MDLAQSIDVIKNAFPNMIIKQCIEYKNEYAFQLVHSENEEHTIDSTYCVNKRTSRISPYNPVFMDKDDYANGKVIELNNELKHFQVPGAKHGVRRYQNEDGSLTELGREHYGIGPARESSLKDKILQKRRESYKKSLLKKAAKQEEKAQKFQAKKEAKEQKALAKQEEEQARKKAIEEEKNRKQQKEAELNKHDDQSKKSISEMTNEELSEYITRLTLEKNALERERDIKNVQEQLNPEKVVLGKKIVDKFVDTAVDTASKYMVNSAQNWLNKTLKASEEPKKKSEYQIAKDKASLAAEKEKYLKSQLAIEKAEKQLKALEEKKKKK